MKLHWHIYLVFSLGNCAHETCTEADLINLSQPNTLLVMSTMLMLTFTQVFSLF
jgi:high-affinity nickel permease